MKGIKFYWNKSNSGYIPKLFVRSHSVYTTMTSELSKTNYFGTSKERMRSMLIIENKMS